MTTLTLDEMEERLALMARSSTCDLQPRDAAAMLDALRAARAADPAGFARKRGSADAVTDELYKALKDYYHECACQRPTMDRVNQGAYWAMRKYEAWRGL